MTVEIGGIEGARIPDFLRAIGGPFLFDIAADRLDQEVERFADQFEVERLRCAFDGAEIVGTLGAFSLDLTCPGSTLACAGTTVVSVQPTHRRQGVLRRLMDAHFADAREREEPVAALFASDSGIYGRFGYGMASVSAEVRIDRSHVEPHRLAPAPGPVRLVEPDEVESTVAGLYERVRRGRPGMFARDARWWRASLRDEERDRHGATAIRCVVAGSPGDEEGYARYRIKPGDWSSGHADGEVQVREVISGTPQAASSLWAYLTGLDLVSSIHAQMLPEDEPVFDLFSAWRRSRPTITDQLWVRLLDVGRALESRRYEADGGLTFGVHDPVDGTTGVWRLEVTEGQASCRPASGPAVELDLEDLGTAYLGRPRFRSLAAAGRVTGSDGDLALADRMFRWSPAPWCQQIF